MNAIHTYSTTLVSRGIEDSQAPSNPIPDQIYLVAYSLIILHSDLFNKNNKRKMQKPEYQKNTGGQGIDEEILGYFYDNIQHAEFITQDPVEAEYDSKTKARNRQSRMSTSFASVNDNMKTAKLDPYDYIINQDTEIENLRPSLHAVMNFDDTYNFAGTVDTCDMRKLREAFAHSGTLEIVSARSRPDAFAEDSTIHNPQQASPGLVAIRVVKIGMVWRKDVKRRKTQRTWQQWGALLTASQLYFFRNVSWTKSLMAQVEAHQRSNNKPLIFKPPLDAFKPDFSMPIPGIVALLDKSYDKHKNAFVLARENDMPYEEILLADNEVEMNDWLSKLNYAAAFHWDNSSDPSSTKQDDVHLRMKVMSARLASVEQKIPSAKEKLEENLRNARHLQILVPFPPRTRSELLTYGARIGLRIRWSRYAIWRLLSERFMLSKALDFERSPVTARNPSAPYTISPRVSSRPGALIRWNSKASARFNPQRSKPPKASSSAPQGSPVSTPTRLNDFEGELSARGSRPNSVLVSRDGSMSITSDVQSSAHMQLTTRDALPGTAPDRFPDRPTSFRRGLSAHSGSDSQTLPSTLPSQRDGAPALGFAPGLQSSPHSPLHTDGVIDLERRLGTLLNYSDQSTLPVTVPGSPDSRKQRRSMPRTLRDSRELQGLHHHKVWRGKDSKSAVTSDDLSVAAESKGITREPGSFTLHGKKASVITLSPEWQNMSVEERLRFRREALEEELKPSNRAGEEADKEPSELLQAPSIVSESDRASYHSGLEDMSPLGSDIFALDYLGPQSPAPVATEIDPASLSIETPPPSERFGQSTVQKLSNTLPIYTQQQMATANAPYETSLRTFLEDASTPDDDGREVIDSVGIALGEPNEPKKPGSKDG